MGLDWGPNAGRKPPVRLTRLQLVLYSLALPAFIALGLAGVVGLYILTDAKRESWVSNTQFAHSFWWLIRKNSATPAFAVNGGLIGAVVCVQALLSHQAAGHPPVRPVGMDDPPPGQPEVKKDK